MLWGCDWLKTNPLFTVYLLDNIETPTYTIPPTNIPTFIPSINPSIKTSSNASDSSIPTISPTNTPTDTPVLLHQNISNNYTKFPSSYPSKRLEPTNSALQLVILISISFGCCLCSIICCLIAIIVYHKNANVVTTFIQHSTFTSENKQPSPKTIMNEPKSIEPEPNIENYPKEGHTNTNDGNV